MPGAGRWLRPRVEAQMAFALIMELYDKGPSLDTKARVEAINKFLAVSRPGVESQIRWPLLFKGGRANEIVHVLRWGLDQFRDGKPFLRAGDPKEPLLQRPNRQYSDAIVWDQLNGRTVRVGSRDPYHLFITRLFELLTEVAPWLRVCQREDCKRFFLFQRPKQIYCSGQCAQRVRMARFLERRAPSSQRGRGK